MQYKCNLTIKKYLFPIKDLKVFHPNLNVVVLGRRECMKFQPTSDHSPVFLFDEFSGEQFEHIHDLFKDSW